MRNITNFVEFQQLIAEETVVWNSSIHFRNRLNLSKLKLIYFQI